MSSRILLALLFSACIAGLLAVSFWSPRRDQGATGADDVLAAPVRAVDADLESVAGAASDLGERRAAVSEPAASGPDPARTEGSDARAEEGPAAVLEKLRPGLLDQFEASFVGAVEPEIFLEAALQLVQLELDPRAIPEPDPTGLIRFPILDTPEGMSAELRVGRTNNQKFAEDVISISLRVDPGKDPYVVEGASREAPEAKITVWRAREGGDVTNFSVLCIMQPDARKTRSLGMPLDVGEIPQSVHYSMDVSDPLNPVTNMAGIQNGSFVKRLDRPFSLGAAPRLQDLRRLSTGLVALYDDAKAR